MDHVRIKSVPICALAVTILFTAALMYAEQTQPTKETFRAVTMSMGTVKGATTTQITITRWTTDAEREELAKTLVESGQDELVKKLQKQQEVGFFRISSSRGYRLYYAREFRKENMRRIILATDRPIAFVEPRRGSRTMDYGVTLIELMLDESTGKGQGSMAVAAKMKVNPESKTLEIENYGTEPVRFTSVTKSN